MGWITWYKVAANLAKTKHHCWSQLLSVTGWLQGWIERRILSSGNCEQAWKTPLFSQRKNCLPSLSWPRISIPRRSQRVFPHLITRAMALILGQSFCTLHSFIFGLCHFQCWSIYQYFGFLDLYWLCWEEASARRWSGMSSIKELSLFFWVARLVCRIVMSLLQKVDELEERLRVSHRYNLRYLQHFRRCKAEIEWYKRRLDATVRASTRARSCNCQLSLKRYEKVISCVCTTSEAIAHLKCEKQCTQSRQRGSTCE